MGGKRTKFRAPRKPRERQGFRDGAQGMGQEQDEARAMLRRAGKHLSIILDVAERSVEEGEVSPALVRETAGAARALVTLSAELRQREKHERQAVAKMTPEEKDDLVAEYIRDLPPDRRQALRVLLDDLDNGGGVL